MSVTLVLPLQTRVGPGCPEPELAGPLSEPIAAITSLAFVVAAVAIPLTARSRLATSSPAERARAPRPLAYAVLVGAVGIGSVLQHGPDPPWADLAHDLPLTATVLFIGADAAADLTGRRRAWWWWAVPTLALAPLVAVAPRAADVTQAGVAAVAVAATLARAYARPGLRHRIGTAVALLAMGGTVGTLSRAGWPLCVPGSVWQGHAVWHVLAAAALVVLAPVVGDPRTRTDAPPLARRPPRP